MIINSLKMDQPSQRDIILKTGLDWNQEIGVDTRFVKFLKEYLSIIQSELDLYHHYKALIHSRAVLSLLGIDWDQFINKRLVFRRKCSNSEIRNEVNKLIHQVISKMSITFHWTSTNALDRNLAVWLTSLICLTPGIDYGLYRSAYGNSLFYIRELKTKSKTSLEFKINLPSIYEGSKEKYRHSNPSILQLGAGYLAIVRAVNYHQERGIHFKSLNPDGIVRTRNYLVGLNSARQIIWSTEIIDKSKTKRYNTQVRGLEDCRLFWIAPGIGCPTKALAPSEAASLVTEDKIKSLDKYGLDFGRIGFTCVTGDTRQTGTAQVSVCKLSSILTKSGTAQVEHVQPLITQGNMHHCEKNWLPFFNQDGLFGLVYSYSPLTIVGCSIVDKWRKQILEPEEQDEEQDEEEVKQHICPVLTKVRSKLNLSLGGFRGSGGPLICELEGKDHYLIATHGVIMNGKRFYHTNLLLYDLNWELQKISLPFFCKNKGIEYCAAIVFSPDRSELTLTMGVEDREAWMCTFTWEEIKKILLPIDCYSIQMEN